MWQTTPRIVIATLTATLALALATVSNVEASTVQSYSYTTDGSASDMAGAQPILFEGNYNTSTLTTPGSMVLGQFVTYSLPATATLTYNNTPFTIDLNVQSQDPDGYYRFSPNSYVYRISGVLNGSISGNGSSSMMASVTGITGFGYGQITSPPFPISDLRINLPQGIAAPYGYHEGYTTITGQILSAGSPLLPAPAPEPSTIAVFGIGLAGLAWHRRTRPRAKKA